MVALLSIAALVAVAEATLCFFFVSCIWIAHEMFTPTVFVVQQITWLIHVFYKTMCIVDCKDTLPLSVFLVINDNPLLTNIFIVFI
jgi:hypothetical protein